jgi:dipeptidyl aminopeptidase/acylaminoacyl peptidase
MRKSALLLLVSILVNPALSQDYSIEQYLNIRGAVSPQYSYDNSRIYFTMGVTGTSQLWYVTSPGGWPSQVTFFQERISGFAVNPKRDLILVEKDEGGSEYDQFFLMSGSGTNIVQITENIPKVLYGFGRWSDDGSFFTYYSNSRSPYYYDIYKYDIDKRSSERIFSSDHSNFPSAISPDGKKMIITRSYTSYDNDLYLLDMITHETTLITRHDNFNNPSEFNSAAFDRKGKELYFVSNKDNGFYRMMKYDIEYETLYEVTFPFLEKFKNFDVSRLHFSNDRSKIMIMVNENGYDRLFMFDFSKMDTAAIPKILTSRSITAIAFSRDDKHLVLGINSSANPSVLYEWELASGIVKQVTFPSFAGIDPTTFVEPFLVSYNSFDGLEIPAFVYLPKQTDRKTKHPCIITIHGGPEGQATYGFSPIIQYFVSAGYAVVEPNVRGSTGYGKEYAALDNVRNRENSVKDIANLVEYLKSRGDIDESRIVVYGGSYGGYMVLACLTLYPEMFAAGVDIVGISNFITFMENTADYRRKNRESEYGSLEKDQEFLQSISPLNRVDKITAPLMIIHGRNDPRVPVGEAEQMYRAVIERGGTAELLIYDDEGHGIAKLKNRLDVYPRIVKFLDQNVINKAN